MAYTYILRCRDGSYYCGWTQDVGRRLREHNEGKAAKYTRGRGPVKLVYKKEHPTKEEAMQQEWAIKRMSRRGKEKLIKEGENSMREPEKAPEQGEPKEESR